MPGTAAALESSSTDCVVPSYRVCVALLVHIDFVLYLNRAVKSCFHSAGEVLFR